MFLKLILKVYLIIFMKIEQDKINKYINKNLIFSKSLQKNFTGFQYKIISSIKCHKL